MWYTRLIYPALAICISTAISLSGCISVMHTEVDARTIPVKYVGINDAMYFFDYSRSGDWRILNEYPDVVHNITEWVWDFGDGNISHEKSPVHYYMKPGTYRPSLTVTSEKGHTQKGYFGNITVIVPILVNLIKNIDYRSDHGNFTYQGFFLNKNESGQVLKISLAYQSPQDYAYGPPQYMYLLYRNVTVYEDLGSIFLYSNQRYNGANFYTFLIPEDVSAAECQAYFYAWNNNSFTKYIITLS